MNKITKLTRIDIIDIIKYGIDNEKIYYFGKLSEIDFLNRVYDLNKMKSNDHRYSNAEQDIYQHRINNHDWSENWVFDDDRFSLSNGEDSILLEFICQIFNPYVRDEKSDWKKILEGINNLLKIDGYELYESSYISNRAVYRWRMIDSIKIVNSLVNENEGQNFELKPIGEGSYAKVFKFKDKNYMETFAVKRANKDLEPKELERFQREFDILKNLDSIFIIKVFNYSKDRLEYTMEYVKDTLEKYLCDNNTKLTFIHRKKMVNQFLLGIKYIHSKGILHRDLSPRNLLIRKYDDGIVRVKISDFGLVVIPNSTLTAVETKFKGSFNDPNLLRDGFSNYSFINEIYSITYIIYFIMTGRKSFDKPYNNYLKEFVDIGMNNDNKERYQDLNQLIEKFNSIPEF